VCLWCNSPVWCNCRTCINYSIQQWCATCSPRAKCNTTNWVFMPVTSTRQPVWNEGAARGLICLIAFGPSVIKVTLAHPPVFDNVKPADSLMLVICIPTITEHLLVAVQPHYLYSQSQYNQLVLSPKAHRWKQCGKLTASQHSLCLHF